LWLLASFHPTLLLSSIKNVLQHKPEHLEFLYQRVVCLADVDLLHSHSFLGQFIGSEVNLALRGVDQGFPFQVHPTVKKQNIFV
jgi:hypothetical protein